MFFLGLLVSLCYVPGVTGAFIATQWPVLSILLPLALWRTGPFTAFHLAGLLFIAYAALRVPYAPVPLDGVWGLWLVCIMGLSFWLGSTVGSLRNLYAGLAIGASVSSVVAVLQALGYVVVPYISVDPAGLYVNSVAQGTFLALLVAGLLSERMWFWVPALLPGIVLANSRGAFLALAVGLLALYVRRLWVFVILGAAGAAFLTHSLGSSDSLRVDIWTQAIANLKFGGWGPGSFFSWLIFHDGTPIYPEYAHNDALQLVFEYGAAAVLPLAVFGFALSRTSEREWPLIATFATAGCYSMPLWMPLASFLGCIAAGRVVRGWALVWDDRHSRRPSFVPRSGPRHSHSGGELIPVVARYPAEGTAI